MCFGLRILWKMKYSKCIEYLLVRFYIDYRIWNQFWPESILHEIFLAIYLLSFWKLLQEMWTVSFLQWKFWRAAMQTGDAYSSGRLVLSQFGFTFL